MYISFLPYHAWKLTFWCLISNNTHNVPLWNRLLWKDPIIPCSTIKVQGIRYYGTRVLTDCSLVCYWVEGYIGLSTPYYSILLNTMWSTEDETFSNKFILMTPRVQRTILSHDIDSVQMTRDYQVMYTTSCPSRQYIIRWYIHQPSTTTALNATHETKEKNRYIRSFKTYEHEHSCAK